MAGNLVIRTAHIEDSETILKLMKEFAAYIDMSEHFMSDVDTIKEEVFVRESAKALIAEVDGYAIGFALYYPTFSSFAGKQGLHIEDLYVTPLFRGHGYGSEIINVIKEIAKKEGYHKLEWRCLKWNQKAQHFYETLGATVQDQSVAFRLPIGEKEYVTM